MVNASQDSGSDRTDSGFSLSNDHPQSVLIPALRAILTSAEQTNGSPWRTDEQLAVALRRLHAILDKLPTMPDAAFLRAIEALAHKKRRPDKVKLAEEKWQSVGNLSLDEIERLIANPGIGKQRLLAIAKERFGASTGTLAKLKQEALRERVAALVMNERGHQAVARLASKDVNANQAWRTPADGADGPSGSHSRASEGE